MASNLPMRMSQRQAVELGDDLRDVVDKLRRKYERRGFEPETVRRELEHMLRQLAGVLAPQRLPR